jgi:scyllo-inositol 2-dehydrogenase (NADP+)
MAHFGLQKPVGFPAKRTPLLGVPRHISNPVTREKRTMLKVAIVGLGKMGLSHQSMINVHPEASLVAVCDSAAYVLDVLSKYTGVKTYTNYETMFSKEALDCVFVATPSKHHAPIVEAALNRGLHVFCEKPFALAPEIGFRLAELAERKNRVNQVGYHCRFIGTFMEAKRLLTQNLIGELHHLRAEAYGPVVLRPKGSTWRSQKREGGGCLFDYACHALDLINFLVGVPKAVSGTVFNSVFSSDVDDEIYSTLHFSEKFHGQLCTNWSDESLRKMSIKLSLWGTNGRINVDRQEIQVYLRMLPNPVEDFTQGWNLRYTTELTQPVWFYVRGEEYSAQVHHFFQSIKSQGSAGSTFRAASEASLVAAMMRQDAAKTRTTIALHPNDAQEINAVLPPKGEKSFLQRVFRG